MLFTEEILRNRVKNNFSNFSGNENYFEKAESILNESIVEQRIFANLNKEYDIFLSHSFKDAVLIAGLKLHLEDLGFSVYVDWIDDGQLNRDRVTRDTAVLLKKG